jgi:hypothetical protein
MATTRDKTNRNGTYRSNGAKIGTIWDINPIGPKTLLTA